jgi:cyanate lyase
VPFVVALCTAKAKKGLTFGQIASEIERDEVWVAAAFFGQVNPKTQFIVFTLDDKYCQAKFSEEELRRVCEVLELNVQPSGLSTWWPNRGLGPFPPQDPIVYQLYEVSTMSEVAITI